MSPDGLLLYSSSNLLLILSSPKPSERPAAVHHTMDEQSSCTSLHDACFFSVSVTCAPTEKSTRKNQSDSGANTRQWGLANGKGQHPWNNESTRNRLREGRCDHCRSAWRIPPPLRRGCHPAVFVQTGKRVREKGKIICGDICHTLAVPSTPCLHLPATATAVIP